MEHIYDMAIIGGGPAGYSSALYATRAGFDTILLEKMAAGGQMTLTGEIENYPGFDEGIDGFALGMKMQNCAERFGAKTEYAEVTGVDFSDKIKKINTSTTTVLAKTVVISTGANPRKLGLANEESLVGNGVHYCAHCDGRFYKYKIVDVLVGGNSAGADALYLSHLAKKVYLVHRRDTFRATKIYQDALQKAPNIEFILNSTVSDFITEASSDFDKKLKGVVIKNIATEKATQLFCDGIFVSIGRKPATEIFADSLKLDDYGYIVADETTRTSVNGVFVAGDVRTKPLRQIVTAVSDGAVAVQYAEEYLQSAFANEN